MKRTTLLLLVLFTAATLHAQLNGNGYYRVQNVYTSRYVRVIDSYGSIDIASTTADMTAIQTIKKFENVVSDPASIVYFEKKSSGYNLRCQGTDTYSIIGYYPLVSDNGNGTYKTYAERAGMVAYLADEISSSVEGVVVSNSKKSRDWYILPVNQTDEHWFGLSPDLQTGNTYAQTFFAEFPFSFASTGMQASIVTKVDDQLGVVVYKDWTGEVPGATPVIVRCTSSNPNDNRLDIHTSSSKSPKENLLKGVYFCNPKKKTTNPHHNVVNNDKTTMRVLGITKDGSLGFVICQDQYIPRNRAWISVSSSAPAELKLVTEEEYAAMQPPVIDEEAFTKEYGNGWYQLTNVATGRMLTLVSNGATTAASLGALTTTEAAAHPGSIFRITATTGGYTLSAQGVDLTSKAGTPFRLWKDEKTGGYLLFSSSGDNDSYIGSTADGKISDDKTSALWQFTAVGAGFSLPTSAATTLPTWTSLYVDFPCTLPASAEAYIVTTLHTDSVPAAILQPVGSRSLPAATPVFICSNEKNATLTVGTTEASQPTGNLLQGNLLPANSAQSYYALDEVATPIQVTVHAAGALGRNQVIIPVGQVVCDTLPLLTQAEYEARVAAAHQAWLEKEEARKQAEEEARRQAEEEARRKAEEEARRQAEEEARRKAEEEARKAHERIVWFANNKEDGWYRLWKKGTNEYLTLTSDVREGLVSQTYNTATYPEAIYSDAGSIFRIDADTSGIMSLRSQGVDVSALLGDTVYMRHNEDDSFTITGLDSTWVPECITGIDGKFMPEFTISIDMYDEYGTSDWAAFCYDFPFTIQGCFALYIPTKTHTATVPCAEWTCIHNSVSGTTTFDVPAGTPVLFRWLQSANTPLIFRIRDNQAVAPDGNLLQGNLLPMSAEGSYHAFEADGKSVVFRRTDSFHPANSAWLPSTDNLQDCLPLMTPEEYEEAVLLAGIELLSKGEEEQLFYTPSGIVVRSRLNELQPGVYIHGGRKIIIK